MKKFLPTITVFTLLAFAAGILWFVRGEDKESIVRESAPEMVKAPEDTAATTHDITQEKTEGVGEDMNMEKSVAATQDKAQSDTAIDTADIDTSNWKEYCNEEYGFCVKYPEGWEVRETTFGGSFLTSFSMTIEDKTMSCDPASFDISIYTQDKIFILRRDYPPHYGKDTPRKLIETVNVSSSLKPNILVRRLVYDSGNIFEDFAEIEHGKYVLRIYALAHPDCQESIEKYFIAMLQSMSPAH